MSVIDKSDVHRWLLGEETVSSDSRENVDNEVVERTVPGVLYLRDVLQLVVDGLNDSPLAQQCLAAIFQIINDLDLTLFRIHVIWGIFADSHFYFFFRKYIEFEFFFLLTLHQNKALCALLQFFNMLPRCLFISELMLSKDSEHSYCAFAAYRPGQEIYLIRKAY